MTMGRATEVGGDEGLGGEAGHPFHVRLDVLLEKHGFDQMTEESCRPYYAERIGRLFLPPGVYFRMFMIG